MMYGMVVAQARAAGGHVRDVVLGIIVITITTLTCVCTPLPRIASWLLPAYEKQACAGRHVAEVSGLQGYCPTSQPAWSAFREPAFGHGTLTFYNSTTALWQWNRNWDNATEYLDTTYIIRERTCPNNRFS